MITDHWYRADTPAGPCRLPRCGRPQSEHSESVGEWRSPRHWFVPSLKALTRCTWCQRPFGHSTHKGTRAHRSLWNR